MALHDLLVHLSRSWGVLRQVIGLAVMFWLAAVGATWLRHRLQAVITRQEAWERPSSRQQIRRAGTRLVHTVALEMAVFAMAVLLLRVAPLSPGRTILV